jgi:Peptidase family M23
VRRSLLALLAAVAAYGFPAEASALVATSWNVEPPSASLWGLAPDARVARPTTDPWVSFEAFELTRQPETQPVTSAARSSDDDAFGAVDEILEAPLEEPSLVPLDTDVDDVPVSLRALPLIPGAQLLDASTRCELALDTTPSLRLWDKDLWVGLPWTPSVRNGHTEKDGTWVEYEQIPRRETRPEAYSAYVYPVPNAVVVSGYDLDRPDEMQRRGKMNMVGHGGVDLIEPEGTPISMIALDHQLGDAEVIFTGHFYGETVVTRHTLREGGKKRDYLLFFCHLQRIPEEVSRGRRLRVGETVGFVGNTDSPNLVHLHLEARRLRDGVDAWTLGLWGLNARETSVICDPRNVLPLRAPARVKNACRPTLMPKRRPSWMVPMALTLEPFDTP